MFQVDQSRSLHLPVPAPAVTAFPRWCPSLGPARLGSSVPWEAPLKPHLLQEEVHDAGAHDEAQKKGTSGAEALHDPHHTNSFSTRSSAQSLHAFRENTGVKEYDSKYGTQNNQGKKTD